MQSQDFRPENRRWRLADGRIYSTATGNWAGEAEALEWAAARGYNYVPPGPVDEAGQSSAAGLRAELERLGLPVTALLDPAQAEAAKLADIMNGYAAAFAPVEAVYPAAEREGWAVQEAEARALTADLEAETPVLSALVLGRARGETTADLAARVLEKAATWRMVYAFLTGQQQRMYGEVTGLAGQKEATAADILAYPVSYALPEGL